MKGFYRGRTKGKERYPGANQEPKKLESKLRSKL